VVTHCPNERTLELKSAARQTYLYVLASHTMAFTRNVLRQCCQTPLLCHRFTPTLSLQTPHVLNHRCWHHLANKLTTYCEQPNRRNLHIWNSHGQLGDHDYSTRAYFGGSVVQHSAAIPYVLHSMIGFPRNSWASNTDFLRSTIFVFWFRVLENNSTCSTYLI